MGSCLVTIRYRTMQLFLMTALGMVSLVSCASVYPPPLLHQYIVPPMVYPGPRTPYTLMGNLINFVIRGNQDRQDSQDTGVQPEDAQAVWISGFPIRRTVQL